MKKFLTILLILSVILSLVVITASASEAVADEGRSTSVFDAFYNFFLHNADKIFAILAFVSSLLLALAYKKGLIPLLKSALGSMKTSVGAMKDEIAKESEDSAKLLHGAAEKLGRAELLFESLSERLLEIDEKLSKSVESGDKILDIEAVLSVETELLYEIFMSSSLPLYQKESVGEKISEMKKLLHNEKRGD